MGLSWSIIGNIGNQIWQAAGKCLGNAWEIPELMEVYSRASHVTDYPMVKPSYLSNIAGPSPQICEIPMQL